MEHGVYRRAWPPLVAKLGNAGVARRPRRGADRHSVARASGAVSPSWQSPWWVHLATAKPSLTSALTSALRPAGAPFGGCLAHRHRYA